MKRSMSELDARSGTATRRARVVVPVRNEAGNVGPLVAEIEAACARLPRSRSSTSMTARRDATPPTSCAELQATRPWLRAHPARHILRPERRGAHRRAAARAPVIVTLDGDGQNDPAYIPKLVAALEAAGPRAGLAAGQRLGRKDTGFKKLQSRVANAVRGAVLKDGTRDTGCGLKGFRRDVYLALPYFDALHRFMPALVRREGYDVVLVDVVDRPRLTGVSNYGFFDRLWVGIIDLTGVWWLIRRRRSIPLVTEERPGDDLRPREMPDARRLLPRPGGLSLRRVRRTVRFLARFRHRRAIALHGALHRAVDRQREGRAKRHADGLLGVLASPAA